MGQIADACENRKIVILNDDVSAPCRIEKEAGWAPFGRRPTKQVPARGRAARLCITATFLTTPRLGFARPDLGIGSDGWRSRRRERSDEPGRRKIGAACASNNARSGGVAEGAGS